MNHSRIIVWMIAAAILASPVMITSSTTASGSEAGVFPDRLFSVAKSGGDNSYSTEVLPSFDGEWWVELVSSGRCSVTAVLKYSGFGGGHQVVCSTDLSAKNPQSKHAAVYGGTSYVLTFTLNNGQGPASLQEHFIPDIPEPSELPPFDTTPRAPISILSDAGFLDPMNGVSGGTGTPADPYVIEGWEISGVADVGIQIWFTSSFVIVRQCFIHAIGFPAHGIYLFMSANVVIENCYVEDCIGSEVSVGSSHNILVSENVIWSDLYVYDTTDYQITGNRIHRSVISIQQSSDLVLQQNTFCDSPWNAIWFVGCHDVVVAHNNFVNNEQNVWLYGSNTISWDLGYPDGGNYWSDYVGQDMNHDGIGDTPYVIDALNQDRYPLVNPV